MRSLSLQRDDDDGGRRQRAALSEQTNHRGEREATVVRGMEGWTGCLEAAQHVIGCEREAVEEEERKEDGERTGGAAATRASYRVVRLSHSTGRGWARAPRRPARRPPPPASRTRCGGRLARRPSPATASSPSPFPFSFLISNCLLSTVACLRVSSWLSVEARGQWRREEGRGGAAPGLVFVPSAPRRPPLCCWRSASLPQLPHHQLVLFLFSFYHFFYSFH